MSNFNTYMQDTQRLMREARQDLINPDDLLRYVNLARRQVAADAQLIRILTPISGSIMSTSVTNPGAGYSGSVASLSISAPDFPSGQLPFPNGLQATGSAAITNGTVSSVSISFGGYGYFQPTFSVVGSPTTQATLTANLTYINELQQGLEGYSFANVNLGAFPGALLVYMVKSVSIIYSNYRYSLPCYSFSTYQAMIRQYPFQYQWVSTMCAQYGRGSAGSFYFYPLPSQPYQMEWDCFVLPQDLLDNTSVDLVPQPFTDCVPLLAAYWGYMELSNFNAATFFKQQYQDWLKQHAVNTTASRMVNPYGRP
jgi:hypothetical protein